MSALEIKTIFAQSHVNSNRSCRSQTSFSSDGHSSGTTALVPKRIVCHATVPTYYAKARSSGLSYAESAQALRYIDSKNPDFIVLDAHYVGHFSEVADWIKYGIQDERAQLIYELGSDPSQKIQIYRWEKR
jgi:hypothetical protein